MEKIRIETDVETYKYDELKEEYKVLIDEACKATNKSYAPYSHFSVGAAALLENGIIVTGNNQENAAYPSGLCAERTTVFYANANYPDQPITALAIAAKTKDGFIESPIPPCGSCRQVLLETEKRFGKKMKVILFSKNNIYIINSAKDLLPFSFDDTFLK